jgi:hypothetical protein
MAATQCTFVNTGGAACNAATVCVPVNRFATLIAVTAVAAVALVLFYLDPMTTGYYPRCLFHQTTGLYCPGCGTTRALHCLLRGRFREAVHDNALAILALPVLGVIILWRFLRWQPPVAGSRFRTIGIVVFLAIVATFGVLRNLPCEPFTWLAPSAETTSNIK